MDLELENRVRTAAFLWLDEQSSPRGEVDVLDGALLEQGFDFEGTRIALAVQQGIHKPKILEAALSLRTSFHSPYADHFADDDTLVYRYQGRDPNAWDNRSARRAFEARLPLIYLHAVSTRSRYAVVRPVYIVADDPAALSFHLQAGLAGEHRAAWTPGGVEYARSAEEPSPIERRYGTILARKRLHQARFREQVLAAYSQQCAMCRLKHPRLLDAAHIVPASAAGGEPTVANGLSLCRIHHGAFDLHYLTVEPSSYRIRVKSALLDEIDGPMLRHGLQELEGEKIQLPRRPRDRPDPERLKAHWERFTTSA